VIVFTFIDSVRVLLQPRVFVPVTPYTVLTEGETMAVFVVEFVVQEYEFAPDAVSV
jgi:hypothetical protein